MCHFLNYLMPTCKFNIIFGAFNGIFVIQLVICLFALGFGSFFQGPNKECQTDLFITCKYNYLCNFFQAGLK